MVTNEVQERFTADELSGTPDGMAVAEGFRLIDKRDAAGMVSGNRAERRLIVGVEDDTRVVDPGPHHFINNHAEHRFLLTVTINEGLERQVSLTFAGSGGAGHASILTRGSIRP
jgi:hypothetical protein